MMTYHLLKNRLRWAVVGAVALALITGCSGGPSTDSETHWVHSCEGDADCEEGLACLCNICTSPCDEGDCLQADDEAVCMKAPDFCGLDGESICLSPCVEDEDCGPGARCRAQSCFPDDFRITEESDEESPSAPEDPQATLPRVTTNFGCELETDRWPTLCDWVEDSDGMVYGEIDEIVAVDNLQQPLSDCDTPHDLRLTISVDHVLYGDVEDHIDVYLQALRYSGWQPNPGMSPEECDEDDPSSVIWQTAEGIDLEPREGPLEVGQSLGLRFGEFDGRYVAHAQRFDPLFVERDGQLALQTGSTFECSNLERSDFDGMPFDHFKTAVAQCGADAGNESTATCEYIYDFPCIGDYCCPEGCNVQSAPIYDLEDECRMGSGPFRCDGPSFGDAVMLWLCNEAGTHAVATPYGPFSPHLPETPTLVECSTLDHVDLELGDTSDLPDCE